eukprot:757680-Hanusia_phi.AAC.4
MAEYELRGERQERGGGGGEGGAGAGAGGLPPSVRCISPPEAKRNELMEIRRKNDEKLSQQKQRRAAEEQVVAGGGVLGGGSGEVDLGRLHLARIRAERAQKEKQHALLCAEAKRKEEQALENKKQVQRMKVD